MLITSWLQVENQIATLLVLNLFALYYYNKYC